MIEKERATGRRLDIGVDNAITLLPSIYTHVTINKEPGVVEAEAERERLYRGSVGEIGKLKGY